jgi:hypothetical protein
MFTVIRPSTRAASASAKYCRVATKTRICRWYWHFRHLTNNTWTDSRLTISKSVTKTYKARVSHGVLISNHKYTVYEFREWENKVLRIIFGLQYKKVIGTRRKLHSEEPRVTLHPLCLLSWLNQEGPDRHYIWYVRERWGKTQNFSRKPLYEQTARKTWMQMWK